MKKLSIYLFTFTLIALFALTSCGDNTHADKAGEKMDEATEEMAKAVEQEKNELLTEIQEAQKTIDERLDKLTADMKESSTEAKANMEAEIEELKDARNSLADDLKKFDEKTDKEWDQFKANVKETIRDIGKDNQM